MKLKLYILSLYLLILSLDPGRYLPWTQHIPNKMHLMPRHTTVRRLRRWGTRCWGVTLGLNQPTSSRPKLFFTSTVQRKITVASRHVLDDYCRGRSSVRLGIDNGLQLSVRRVSVGRR